MKVDLAFGRSGIQVDIPDRHFTKSLTYKQALPLEAPEAALSALLAEPLNAPPLRDLAKGKQSVCILICDITRPVPNELILGEVLNELEAAGIDDKDILILNATGLHRPNTPEELTEMVGSRIASRYRIENHIGTDLDSHTYLGESPRGVPIWIDSRYVEADLKITTGLIEPHFMAGYSGGRKLICPGIAALETVRVWHGPKFLEHPNATTGVLLDNPVHEENTWIAQRAGCDFIVNVVIDDLRRPVKFVAGDMVAAFEAGAEFVESIVTDHIPKEADIVVTSGAGYPLDTTFYQSVKGMVGAMPIVKEGGTIIIAASCSEGIGSPPFQQLYDENRSVEEFMDRILNSDYFVMDQWQLEEFAKVAKKASIQMVSDGLSAETLQRLFVQPADSVEAAIDSALTEHGPNATIAVIPKGPYVIAQVAE